MLVRSYQGVIALDIDGTITSETHFIHPDVVTYFDFLQAKGWKFIFITGRPFQWGIQVLQYLSFPYLLAVQNGALTLEMPSQKVIDRRYLATDILPGMESICQEEETDFIIYSGFENEDWCYYRPSFFSQEWLSYLQQRVLILKERWQPLSSFKDLPISLFSSLKCFAKEKQASRLSQQIEEKLSLHAPLNRDPFCSECFVIQATHPQATKGHALRRFIHSFPQPHVVIAAGDDYNDLSMLQASDIKVVMASAPSDLQRLADIIAPPAIHNGIIQGLSEAIKKVNSVGGMHV